MKKLVHNVSTNKIDIIDLTAKEISQREIDIEENKKKETAEANDKQAKIDLKASAKAKLIAGEPLTEEEANTIVL